MEIIGRVLLQTFTILSPKCHIQSIRKSFTLPQKYVQDIFFSYSFASPTPSPSVCHTVATVTLSNLAGQVTP